MRVFLQSEDWNGKGRSQKCLRQNRGIIRHQFFLPGTQCVTQNFFVPPSSGFAGASVAITKS
jgi:hypothetical protein